MKIKSFVLFVAILSTAIASFAVDSIDYIGRIDFNSIDNVNAIPYANTLFSTNNIAANPIGCLSSFTIDDWMNLITNVNVGSIDVVVNTPISIDVSSTQCLIALLCNHTNVPVLNVSSIASVCSNNYFSLYNVYCIDSTSNTVPIITFDTVTIETFAKALQIIGNNDTAEISLIGYKALIINRLTDILKQNYCVSNNSFSVSDVASFKCVNLTNTIGKVRNFSTINTVSNVIGVQRVIPVARLNVISGIYQISVSDMAKLMESVRKYESRFDLLDPHVMSSLGAIKEKAKKMEAKGEDTEQLWNMYWNLFWEGTQGQEDDDL